MKQDWLFALRSLRAHASGHALVVLVIAVGIAGSALAFGMLHEGLIRALPYERPDELYLFEHVNAESPVTRVSPLDAEDLRGALDWEQRFTTWAFEPRNSIATVGTEEGPKPATIAYVDGAFFGVAGVQAALGRGLGWADDEPGQDAVVVLSHRVWTRIFGADPSVVGRTVRVDGVANEVVGVMPPDFHLPTPEVDLFVPGSRMTEDMVPNLRQVRYRRAMLRVPTATSLDREVEEIESTLLAMEERYPDTNEGWTGARLVPLRDELVAGYRDGVVFLTVVTLLLLLVVASAVGALQTARTSGRGRELAVRMSLGADRVRVARQLVFESMTLAGIGGILGFGLAVLLGPLASDFASETMGLSADVRPDLVVAGFTAAVSVVTGALFGLMPALGVLRAPPGAFLGGARSGAGGFRRGLGLLVVAETSLAMVLLVGTGLMLRSVQSLLNVDPGFESEDVWTVRYRLPMEGDFAQLASDRDRVLAIAREVPGVSAVGGSKTGLLEGGGEPYRFSVGTAGGAPVEVTPDAGTLLVLPGFFEALGVDFVSGRAFTAADPRSTVVVNRAFAERHWPGGDAVGRSLGMGSTRFTITGVVESLRDMGLRNGEASAVYANAASFPRLSLFLYVRTEPGVSIEPTLRAIEAEFPGMAAISTRRVSDVLDAEVARPRWLARVSSGFGVLALLLAALGVYGVIAQAVQRRRGDIAVRIALGASPRRVVGEQMRAGLGLLVVGTAIGGVGAVVLGRVIASLLFGVEPVDPLSFATAAVVILSAGAAAALIPSVRASRVDPAGVIREE